MMISLALAAVALAVEHEGRALLVDAARAVDQRMDGLRAGAALVAQHQRRLAGKGGEDDVAIDGLGDMARQRRLAGAGIAEQAKELRLAGLQPARDGAERGVLLRRPVHRRRTEHEHRAAKGTKSRAAWQAPARPIAQAARSRRTNIERLASAARRCAGRGRARLRRPRSACATDCRVGDGDLRHRLGRRRSVTADMRADRVAERAEQFGMRADHGRDFGAGLLDSASTRSAIAGNGVRGHATARSSTTAIRADDLRRRVRRLPGQRLDLAGDDGKAPAMRAGARRLDRRIERQQIGLPRDRLDQPDHIADLAGIIGQPVDEIARARQPPASPQSPSRRPGGPRC